MLTVGDQFPQFNLKAVVSADADRPFGQVTNSADEGRWKIFFFWPKDFTYVCPTEIVAFASLNAEFNDRGAVLYGASIDSEFVHRAWRAHHPDLKELPFAMLSDIKRELSTALGILHQTEGVCLRATFIVDPAGLIRHVSVYDLLVGRNPQETLRTLDALLVGAPCPCNLRKPEPALATG